MTRKYELTEDEARLCFQLVDSHCKAIKNWMASAVERGDNLHARGLVADLRKHEDLYAKLNVDAHNFLDKGVVK